MQLLFKVECSGEDFYNQLADRVASPEAAELLRRNGREELGHARRIQRALAIKLGEPFEPTGEMLERFPIPLPREVGPDLFPIIIEAEVQGDAGYEKWAEKESDPEVARLLRLNGREETIHAERARQALALLQAAPPVLSALRPLPDLLRDEPALTRVLGRSSAVLAVPEPARAVTVAGLARLSSRRPIVVAVPDHDRRRAPRPRPRRVPRRRRRSSSSRPGRRCRSSGSARASRRWAAGCARCGACAGRPATRPSRAGGDRGAGPGARAAARPARRATSSRSSSAAADQLDPTELVADLVGAGYRREELVEHRGEVARARLDRRRVPLDRRRARPHRPVGRRGRPADRVLGQRPALDRSTSPRSRSSRAASCCRPTRSGAAGRGARRHGAVGARAVGAPGRGPGLRRHGVAGCRGWPTTSSVLLDLLAADAPGAAGRAPAHARPGRRPPRRGGRPGRAPSRARGARRPPMADAGVPAACTSPFDRLLAAHRRAPAWTVDRPRPRGPTSPRWPPPAGTRSSATAPRLVKQLRELLADGYRVVVAADGDGIGRPAARRCWPTRASHLAPRRAGRRPTARRPRRGRPARARASSLPVGQAGRAGRGRPHRPPPRPPPGPPAPPRDARASSTTSSPATTSCTTSTASARYGGMVKRAIGGVERDYLLLEYKGDDKLYVPSDQIDARAPLHRRRVARRCTASAAATWQKAKARVRSAVRRDRPGAGRALPDAGAHARATRSRPTRRGSASSRTRSRTSETPDQRKADRRRQGATWRRRRRWTGSCAATSASARPRSRSGPCSRRCRTASRSRCSCRPRCSPSSTSRPSATASPATPCGSRCCRRFLTTAQARKVVDGLAIGEVDVVIGTHRLLSDDVTFKDLGLLVVDEEQRFGVSHKEAIKQLQDRRRRAHAHGDADPAHARDEPHRHPRPHAAQHAAGRPPADPHLRRRVRRPRRRRGDPPRAAARGPGVLRAQPRAGHREGGRRAARARARGPHRRRPRPDGRGLARADRASTSGRASTTCSCARRSSSRASTCRR